jgi:hypothetical protein
VIYLEEANECLPARATRTSLSSYADSEIEGRAVHPWLLFGVARTFLLGECAQLTDLRPRTLVQYQRWFAPQGAARLEKLQTTCPKRAGSRVIGCRPLRADLSHGEENMSKYLCLQRSLPSADAPKPSPAAMQEMYAKFGAWQERFKDNLTDMGGKLGDGRLVTAEVASDGPFVEVKELVGGYMIVSAETLDEAIEVAKQCPGLVRPGSGVEVIEIHGP